jgi:hypothetical protein
MKFVCVLCPLMKELRGVGFDYKKLSRLRWLSASRGFYERGIRWVVRQWGLFLMAYTTSRRTSRNGFHKNKLRKIKSRLESCNPYRDRLQKVPTCITSLIRFIKIRRVHEILTNSFNNRFINIQDGKRNL